MNKAEQLITCLEGEIAKRDETIARLEPQLNRAIQANYDLREELAAIKAQEPSYHVRALNDALTFGIGMIELNSDGTSEHVPAESLYAAPVSEAKAQDFDPLVCDYCNAETQYRHTACGGAKIRVTSKIAGDCYAIDAHF